jgi:DNA helicase-2/ATP-dependent DNA helicase PcrA
VGDPDQSIYRFRGADYRNLSRFQRDYPDAQIILLEHNYRSHQLILDAAMAIIDKNEDRIKKQLTTSREDGSRLNLKNLADENDEAQYVVWTIDQYRRSGRFNLRDCAIMYRTNAQSRALEDVFVRANIPYRLVGSVRFYSRREIKDVLAYLRLAQNPDDSVSLNRILNVPPRGIGQQTAATLAEWAEKRGESLYEAIQAIDSATDSPFKGRASKALIEFGKLLVRWRDLREKAPIGALLKDILEQTAYLHYLKDGTPEGEDRVQNVQELYRVTENAGARMLDEFLEEIALVSDVDSLDESADGAVMLTLHAAKGLEFPVVFIVGLEEGLLPHQNAADDPEQMAEERRLMYVGLTRAKDVLHLTWTTRRSLYGNMGERSVPSRFLTELPDELVTGSPVPGRPTTYDAERLAARRAGPWRPPMPPARAINAPVRPAVRITSMYKAGQRVRHERFGDGIIIASAIRGADEEIDVRFEKFGIKRLSASIAPLTLVEDD